MIDGASDFFCELFGPENGQHARSAVGIAELPHGIPVEINGEFELRYETSREWESERRQTGRVRRSAGGTARREVRNTHHRRFTWLLACVTSQFRFRIEKAAQFFEQAFSG